MGEDPPDTYQVKVVFNPAPGYLPDPEQARTMVFKHPPAPGDVQKIIDQINFED
jgi:hypothetical protein